MKTKFVKVSVQERLPNKTEKYLTDKGKLVFGSVMKTWYEDKLRASPNYWLEEVPDREEEMREMLETILKMHNHGEFISQNELDKIKHFLTN